MYSIINIKLKINHYHEFFQHGCLVGLAEIQCVGVAARGVRTIKHGRILSERAVALQCIGFKNENKHVIK